MSVLGYAAGLAGQRTLHPLVKTPLCSFLACVHFKRHNAIEKAPQYLEFTVNLFTHSW